MGAATTPRVLAASPSVVFGSSVAAVPAVIVSSSVRENPIWAGDHMVGQTRAWEVF